MSPGLGGLDEADDVAVGVLHGSDELAAAHVLDRLQRFRSGGQEHLKATANMSWSTNASRSAGVNRALGGSGPAAREPRTPPRVAFAFTITDGKIVAIDLIADPTRLGQVDLATGRE